MEGPQGDPTCSGGLDEDCDTLIDGNDPGCQTLCIDQDGDGYGVNGDTSCGVPGQIDCDDSNAAVNPAGDDANCNGIDENCVGGADSEYVSDTLCGTGECQANNIPSSCTGGVEMLCQPGTAGTEGPAGDLTCTGGLDEDCDGLIDEVPGIEDPDCSATEIDNDGDGYCAAASCTDGSLPNDCDDTDPNVYPGAPKICDGKDSNCDGKKDSPTDEDKDNDGVPWCAGDCDDNNPLAYPGNTEGPFGDPTCSDGIDNDCQNGADAADSKCVVSCETKTNPKDGPHVETMKAPGPDGLPNTGDDIIHPENNNLLCGKCHGATLQDPIRYACDRCHEAGGTSKATYPDPWPFGFGSAPDVQMHSSTVLGTKYGAWDLDCVTCHNPHLQEQDRAYGTSYGQYIKEYICFDNPVTALNIEEIIEFTAASGAGSFADGPPINENICNMCHTQTNHHRRDDAPPAPGGQDHNNGQECTTCHPHNDGFAPTGGEPAAPHDTGRFLTECELCHVTPTDFSTIIPDSKCEQCHTPAGIEKSNFPLAPDVLTHADINGSGKYVYTNACVDCHNPMFDQPNLALIRPVIQKSVMGGNIVFTSFSGPNSFADGAPYPDNICNTCHSLTNHHQADGIIELPNTGTQDHNNNADCRGCHPHTDGFLPTGGEPAPPHDSQPFIDNCDYCHVTASDFSTPVPNSKCEQCHTPSGILKGGFPAAPDVFTHQGRECVECHDPMFGSSNLKLVKTTIAGSIVPGSTINFTSFAGLNSFGNGPPYPENICDTCHSATDHHQSDGTAPGGQLHENGSDCRSCHNHNDANGAWAAPNIMAAAPHDSITDCNLCHVGGRYSNQVPNSSCDNCHTPGGAEKVNYPTAPDVETHRNRNCTECHDPMYASTLNLSLVRERITGSIVPGSNIVFTALIGTGSFADGPPYPENICETCHSATNHHQSDGTAPGGQSHNDGSNCTTECHPHLDGFAPSGGLAVPPHDVITDCGLCHTGPSFSDPVPNTACANCHTPGGSAKGSYPTAPNVMTHQGRECVECHDPMFGSTNEQLIRTTIAGSIVPGSNIVFTAFSGAGSFADGMPYPENICDTCHSLTNHHQSDGTAPGGQDHENGSNCTICHNHNDPNGGFFPSAPFAAAPHNVITDCGLCHTGPNFSDPVPNTACANCHTPGGSAKVSYPTAPDVMTHQGRECVECHDPMNGSTNQNVVRTMIAGSIVPGSNIVFTAFSGAGSFADGPPYNENICETCHSMTNHHQSDGVAPGGQDHENGSDCRTCHDHNDPAGAWKAPVFTVPGVHSVITDCALCHIGPNFSDPVPNTACNSCHTAAGVNKTSYPTSPDVVTHQGRNCVECHDPMFDSGSPNQDLVRSMIAGSIVPGSMINFTTYMGAGSFADGPPYNENICETCHSATNHHQSDGTAPGGQDHENNSDCRTCHDHNDPAGAWAAPNILADAPHDVITDCGLCHTGPNFSDPIPDSACESCHTPTGANKGSYPSAPDVATHAGNSYGPFSRECVDCHNPMYPQTNQKHVRTDMVAAGGANNVVFPPYVVGAAPWNGVCENCHTMTNHHQSDGSAPGGQSHNNTATCTDCHPHLEGFLPVVDVPPPHDVFTDCTVCHVGSDFSALIPDSKCEGCHSDAAPGTTGGGSDIKVKTHGDSVNPPRPYTYSNACVDCHNPMYVQPNLSFIRPTIAASVMGGTINFTSITGAGSFADGPPHMDNICETCHSQTQHHQADGTAPGGQSHFDSEDCTGCHPHNDGFQPTGGCTICHSIEQGNRGAVVNQFAGNSHHIQGVELTDEHCYQCHWEADSDGSINPAYHGGPANPGSVVNLVIYGSTTRPTTYNLGASAVEYDAAGSSGGGSGGGSPPFNQVDEFNGVTHETRVTSNPGATNWTAVTGSDGKNAWCYGTQATDSSSTGTNPGNPVPFVFIESSSNGTSTCGNSIALGSSQYLQSNTLDASTYAFSFSFDYNMQIGGNGSLYLDAWNGSSWDLDVTGGAIASGSQGTSWYTAGPYDLSSYSNADFKLRIRFVVSSNGSVWKNDLMLDNLAITAGGGSGSTRTELEKINMVCLGCHDADSTAAQPFRDGNTPSAYAWDGMSISERYSQTGTTPWGKYSDTGSTDITPKNTQTKAYSAHGNAAANEQGWDLNETWPDTSGSVNILCFDCHNSHGSTVSGTTTSYSSATTNGAILKDTIAGKGGYTMTYQPKAGGSAADNNAHNAGAGICFDCHLSADPGTTPWGYSGTFGAQESILGYRDTDYFGPGLAGAQERFSFRQALTQLGGHFGASSPLTTSVNGTINGLCTPCHDPHGVSPALGANQQYGVPLLKGTWLTSPYKEDVAPSAVNECRGVRGESANQPAFCGASTPGYHIDQNTFANWDFNSTASVTQNDTQFAGLCLQCHTESSLNPDTTSSWRSVDRIHNSVKGWDSDGNTMHRYTCSKCHTPHNAALGRLMITNCLDSAHRGRVETGGRGGQGSYSEGSPSSSESGRGSGSFPAGGGGIGEDGSRTFSYFFGTIAGGRACHDNTNNDGFPDDQLWNVVTPWGQLGN